MTTLFIILFVLPLLLLVAFGCFFFYLYYWQIQRPLPQLDGELSVPIFNEPVEIRRDQHGVPHIYAKSRADLFRAQGFVHAQDRLWQMEQQRRIARGTLAELFGEAALDADRFSRIIGFWRAAQSELSEIDSETRQVLDWYAEGVNAYLQARPKRLAAEFNLLRIRPDPWTALDTLGYGKVMGWSLSINWESELTRLRLLQQLGPNAAADLEPDYPQKSPIVLEGVGSAEVKRLAETATRLLDQYETLRQWLGNPAQGQGSNAWVLAPKNSLNGRPLLCNDPHMNVAIPGPWYENHLICPDYEVSGASLPGIPAVIIGHNEQIAWGFTNAHVDVQDLYLERPASDLSDSSDLSTPGLPPRFEYNGQSEAAQVIEETIRIRRRQPHIEKVIITRHGPIISNLVPDKETRRQGDKEHTPPLLVSLSPCLHLSLRWTGHEPGQTLRAILKLNQATDWLSFEEALADWAMPVQNAVFADARGYIGYRMCGKVPIRHKNLGLVPAAGWTSDHEWNGYIPHAELPHLYNPSSGKIVTANNKMVGDDYPYFLGIEFLPGFRAARIEELLNHKDRYTIRDMEEIQLDTASKYAEALTPWFTLLQSDDPWEKNALQTLRRWKFRMDIDDPAGTLFHFILIELLNLTFGDKLGGDKLGGDKLGGDKLGDVKNDYFGQSRTPLFLIHGFMGRAETRLLELLNTQERSIWYRDVATGHQRTREELLQAAVSSAMKKVRHQIGEVNTRWHWGRAHQVLYNHPLGSARLVGRFFNRGPIAVGGDSHSPNQTRHAPQLPLGLVQVAASYRQIYEVGSWDRAQTVTTPGQSGHPVSPHYDSQMMMWKEGAYHKMPWSRTEVERGTHHRLLLRS